MAQVSDNTKLAYENGIQEAWRQLREAVYRTIRGWTAVEREAAGTVVNALVPVVYNLTGMCREKALAACVKRLNEDGRL